MDQETMASLQWLRKTLATLATTLKNDQELLAQCVLSAKLVDRMIVANSVATGIRAEYHAGVMAILLNLPSLLPDLPETSAAGTTANSISEIIENIKTIEAVSDTAAFDRFNELVTTLHCRLLAARSPSTASITNSLSKLEAEYYERFAKAVDVQYTRAMAEAKGGSASTNVREYDEAKLLDFLQRTFPEETELQIANSTFISGGFSKITLGITVCNTKSLPRDLIVRAGAETIYGGVSVVQEYRLFQILFAHGVCIPKPLAVEETGKDFGAPFMLTEKRPGRTIGHMFQLPDRNIKTCDDVARTLAAIHQVPIHALDRHFEGGFSRNSEKILTWLDQAEANFRPLGISSMVFQSAFDWLRRNAHLNDAAPRTLVHGDYGLNNILIDGDRVSAVLDWEFSHIGNPAYDLGYFYFMAETLGSWNDFLRAYAEGGGPIPDQQQLDYHVLFAATRLAVMVCQTGALFQNKGDVPLIIAAVIAEGCFNENIKRISYALERASNQNPATERVSA